MSNKVKLRFAYAFTIFGIIITACGFVSIILRLVPFYITIAIFVHGIAAILVGIYFFKHSIPPAKKPFQSHIIRTKPTNQKTNKPKKNKKPFISDKEWKDLDEEDEECMYIDED